MAAAMGAYRVFVEIAQVVSRPRASAAPFSVAEVEVEPVIKSAYADVHVACGCIELRLRLNGM